MNKFNYVIYYMLITTKEHYVMIKSAKMRTDRETKQSTKANTSSTNKSYY